MAQPATIPGKVANFKIVPEWYTNQSRMKSLLEGVEAQPLPGNKAQVKGASLQTFRESGEPELLVKTPECLYDGVAKTLSSAATLRAETANGKFSIQGEGFHWSQTNSALIISNQVHTVLHPDMMKSATAEPGRGDRDSRDSPVEIFSTTFAYSKETGDGVYDGGVRVAGTNLNLTSRSLRFVLPFAERQVQRIAAEREVVLDYSGVHATGQRAVYTADTDMVEVTGQPAWTAQGREGRADRVIIDRTNKTFHALGHGWLKLPGQGFHQSDFLAADPSRAKQNSAAPTNQFLEISADDYLIRTNSAAFRGNVKVLQLAGAETLGTLDCASLDVEFAGTNELRKLVARENVVITQGEARFSAQQAVYTAATGLLELTGNPQWQAGPRSGKGDLITVNLKQEEMLVSGRASMRLPASELGRMAIKPGSTRPESKPAAGAPADFAEIFAEDYTLAPTRATFRGGVYITHPQMAWASERVTVSFPRGGGAVDGILAERGVMFDLVDDRGQKLHGKGEQALYTFAIVNQRTNDVVELSGDPMIQTTNGTFRNRVIYLDRASGKLIAPGRYALRGAATLMDTNLLRWPIK